MSATDQNDRLAALGLLARSPTALLSRCMTELGSPQAVVWLRKPQTGTLMLRGRIGGDGAAFNLGEATVTRCTLRTEAGIVGVGTVMGTDARKAELVARCDALLQQAALAPDVRTKVIDVLAREERQRHANEAAATAASKVDFFTMVRGEDA